MTFINRDYTLSSVPQIIETRDGPKLSAVGRLTIGESHYDLVDGFQFIDVETGDIVLVLPAWNVPSP